MQSLRQTKQLACRGPKDACAGKRPRSDCMVLSEDPELPGWRVEQRSNARGRKWKIYQMPAVNPFPCKFSAALIKRDGLEAVEGAAARRAAQGLHGAHGDAVQYARARGSHAENCATRPLGTRSRALLQASAALKSGRRAKKTPSAAG